MEKTMMFIVCSTLVLLCSTSAYAQKGESPPSYSLHKYAIKVCDFGMSWFVGILLVSYLFPSITAVHVLLMEALGFLIWRKDINGLEDL